MSYFDFPLQLCVFRYKQMCCFMTSVSVIYNLYLFFLYALPANMFLTECTKRKKIIFICNYANSSTIQDLKWYLICSDTLCGSTLIHVWVAEVLMEVLTWESKITSGGVEKRGHLSSSHQTLVWSVSFVIFKTIKLQVTQGIRELFDRRSHALLSVHPLNPPAPTQTAHFSPKLQGALLV